MIQNEVRIGGRIAGDIQVRVTPNGKTVANGTIAFNPPPRYDRAGNLVKSDPVFVDFERWGESAAEYPTRFPKGSAVWAHAKLLSDHWEDKQRGIKRSQLKIRIDQMQKAGVTQPDFCMVLVCGNLTRDPEIHDRANGKLAAFGIAINDFQWTDESGTKHDNPTTFVDACCFDDDASNMVKFRKSGNTVLCTGTLYTNRWTPQGSDKQISQLRMACTRGGVRFLTRDSEKAQREEAQKGGSEGSQPNPESRFARNPRDEQKPVGAAAPSSSNDALDEDIPF